jgi:translation initiation factor 1 (eIF-1/SUI1)
VICIEGLSEAALAELLPRLKRELGCSGRADGSMLVAGTGDHQRVAKWLRAAGATKVVVGN